MVQVPKIDSNITGCAYAEESAELGVLPTNPVWTQIVPNSYSDFGGSLTLVTPTPITDTRQQKKGNVVDLSATAGFNQDLTFFNTQGLLPGVLFADFRRKPRQAVTSVNIDSGNPDEYIVASSTGFRVGQLIKGVNFKSSNNNRVSPIVAVSATKVEVANGVLSNETTTDSYIQVVGVAGAAGDIHFDATGDFAKITSTILDFTTLGLIVGQWIFVGGDADSTKSKIPANNGFKRVRSISAHTLIIDKSFISMTTSTETVIIHIYFGDVIKNEVGTEIKRRSFHFERTLGFSDTDKSTEVQSEIVTGAVSNEFTINAAQSSLVSVDFSFLGTDHIQRSTSPLQKDVQKSLSADPYNTSSDFSRIKMSLVSDTDEAPAPLFAFITEATLTVNNNLDPNKAVGVLGAFDITAGIFTVTGSINAYFSNVSAIAAIRNNANVTFDVALVKKNQGIIIDFPLVSLGDGRLNVEQNQSIKIPLSLSAADAEGVALGMGHTILFTFFGYLPDAAQ
jgi:hypothetical protein